MALPHVLAVWTPFEEKAAGAQRGQRARTNRQEELPHIVIGIDIEVHDWLDGEERWCKGDWILDQMPLLGCQQ